MNDKRISNLSKETYIKTKLHEHAIEQLPRKYSWVSVILPSLFTCVFLSLSIVLFFDYDASVLSMFFSQEEITVILNNQKYSNLTIDTRMISLFTLLFSLILTCFVPFLTSKIQLFLYTKYIKRIIETPIVYKNIEILIVLLLLCTGILYFYYMHMIQNLIENIAVIETLQGK